MSEKILVLADAHLEKIDDELEIFVRFLHTLHPPEIHSLYILGDLFNIWIGVSQMQLAHQQPVLDALFALRHAGIAVKYVEGNRDYFLSPLYLNAPFHAIMQEYAVEQIGAQRVYFAHGDLVNSDDTQYRRWRAFSRSKGAAILFRCLPQSLAVYVAHSLEQTLRGTNQKHKRFFPEQACQQYAEQLWNAGNDVIVLGHFHEQRYMASSSQIPPKSLYILPAWKQTHTYLEILPDGQIAFRQYPASSFYVK